MAIFRRVSIPTSVALAVATVLGGMPDAYAQRANGNLSARAAALEAAYQAQTPPLSHADALAQMEALLVECGKQRNCQSEPLLAGYRRLLQEGMVREQGDEPGRAGSLAGDVPGEDEGDEDEDPMIDIAGDAVPDAATADALLDERNRRFAQAVQFNPAVQAGIRRWLTDMRPALMESYVNYQYLRPHMAPAFQRAGLPEALLFGIMAKESNGKVHVTSRAGAAGPLQFMPATGRRFGLGGDGTGFDTRFDARLSAEAAAAYLQERYAQLNGNIEMSLAAYNGGEGRALRIHQQSGGRNFWDASVYDQFPAETRDYVPMVIAAAWLYLHPQDYGLRFPRTWGAGRVAQIQLKHATTLNGLTICLGNARGSNGYQRALRNLNPRYRLNDHLPEGTTLTVTNTIASLYNRHCVSGKRADITRQLMQSEVRQAVVRVGSFVAQEAPVDPVTNSAPAASAPPAAPSRPAPPPATTRQAAQSRQATRTQSVRTHRVARGETLNGIANRYRCNLRELAAANNIRAPRYAIQPGQTLRLVGCNAPRR